MCCRQEQRKQREGDVERVWDFVFVCVESGWSERVIETSNQSPSRQQRAGGGLFPVVMLLSVPVFLFFPRMPINRWVECGLEVEARSLTCLLNPLCDNLCHADVHCRGNKQGEGRGGCKILPAAQVFGRTERALLSLARGFSLPGCCGYCFLRALPHVMFVFLFSAAKLCLLTKEAGAVSSDGTFKTNIIGRLPLTRRKLAPYVLDGFSPSLYN